MTSQRDLARAFERGRTGVRASSVRIADTGAGSSAIVDTRGEGAVYAFRYAHGGIVAFEGWYDYSPSTSCIMTKMGLSPTCRHDDDRDYRAHATSADAPRLRELDVWVEEHDPTFIGHDAE